MKIDFLLNYTPDPEYNEIGYHATYSKYYDNIINNGFHASNEDNDWLGAGIYFWDDMTNANWWKKKLTKNEEKCIIKCNLSCKRENYIDLDVEMEKFEEFLTQYSAAMKNANELKPNFKTKEQRRKYYCDIYSIQNNICIMSYTFKHDIVNKFGFITGSIDRRQICVKNNACISIVGKGN